MPGFSTRANSALPTRSSIAQSATTDAPHGNQTKSQPSIMMWHVSPECDTIGLTQQIQVKTNV